MTYPHLAKKITKALVGLYNGLSTATLTLIGTWPSNGSKLQIVASAITDHTDCVGDVIINGTDTYHFSQAGTKRTTTSLTAKPTITTSGLDCNLVITCTDSGGQPIYEETETDLPCRIYPKRKSIPFPQGGVTSIQETLVESRDLTIIPLDSIKFDLINRKDPTNGTAKPVASIEPIDGPGGAEHKRILRF
jgi:hypothetical protein